MISLPIKTTLYLAWPTHMAISDIEEIHMAIFHINYFKYFYKENIMPFNKIPLNTTICCSVTKKTRGILFVVCTSPLLDIHRLKYDYDIFIEA
jgi:hypothetical protein